MKRTKLMRKTPLSRGEPLKADREKTRAWRERSNDAAMERARGREGERSAAPVRFKAKTPARTQACRCGERATGWHHWLPQQQIRVYVRGLRLDGRASRRRLRSLLADERNLIAVCAACHDLIDPLLGLGPQARRCDVPASAFEFAAELGAEWLVRLERLYPVVAEREAA